MEKSHGFSVNEIRAKPNHDSQIIRLFIHYINYTNHTNYTTIIYFPITSCNAMEHYKTR